MDERCCRDESVALRASIRNAHPRAPSSHLHVEGEDAAFECRQDVLVEPSPQSFALNGVAPLDQQDAEFKFQHNARIERDRVWPTRRGMSSFHRAAIPRPS